MDEAVERAAIAWHARQEAERRDAARFREDGQQWQWSDLPEFDRISYRAVVRPIVEAAMHHLRGVERERDEAQRDAASLRDALMDTK